jgi:hypothetical protein
LTVSASNSTATWTTAGQSRQMSEDEITVFQLRRPEQAQRHSGNR